MPTPKSNKKIFKPTVAIPTGETIREILDERGMSQKQFAEKMKVASSYVNNIINGRKPITVKTAIKIGNILKIDPIFLLNLESQYRLLLAQKK